jgi:hypothetical protein
MDLLDLMELEDDRAKLTECLHRQEQRTFTDWGPPYGIRMTWTCVACSHIRGRVDNKPEGDHGR